MSEPEQEPEIPEDLIQLADAAFKRLGDAVGQKVRAHLSDETLPGWLREVGVPGDFLESLLKESDWSHIIKAHAFLEAVCSQAISTALGDPRLLQFATRIEMSNNDTGKVAVLRALNLGSKRTLIAIRELSTLRNKMVHDVSKINFSLSDHVASLNNQQQDKFFNSFFIEDRSPSLTMHGYDHRERALQNPRFFLAQATISIFLSIITDVKIRSLRFFPDEHPLFYKSLTDDEKAYLAFNRVREKGKWTDWRSAVQDYVAPMFTEDGYEALRADLIREFDEPDEGPSTDA